MTIRKLKMFRKNRGFTLVELMIVVAIVGILAALAIYGVTKYMANAKTAEARTSLGQISKDASSAFSRDRMAADFIDKGESSTINNALCASAAATVPATIAEVKGKKYQSEASEWAAGDTNTGWACLKFSMSEPQYYMYGYAASGTTGVDGETFTATAQGDLDGDTVPSTFEMQGEIEDRVVKTFPTIKETNPEE
jgi:type IV pilus assembly protein PilA